MFSLLRKRIIIIIIIIILITIIRLHDSTGSFREEKRACIIKSFMRRKDLVSLSANQPTTLTTLSRLSLISRNIYTSSSKELRRVSNRLHWGEKRQSIIRVDSSSRSWGKTKQEKTTCRRRFVQRLEESFKKKRKKERKKKLSCTGGTLSTSRGLYSFKFRQHVNPRRSSNKRDKDLSAQS